MNIENFQSKHKFSLIDIQDALKNVYDPDISVSIYDLGLIYKIDILNNSIIITMTLTSPSCPEAITLPEMAKQSIIEKINNNDVIVEVNVVFDPPWTVENMSDEALLKLNLL